jgi:hypothetical protein
MRWNATGPRPELVQISTNTDDMPDAGQPLLVT